MIIRIFDETFLTNLFNYIVTDVLILSQSKNVCNKHRKLRTD